MTSIRTWSELGDPDEVADALCALFHARGDEHYDESVSQTVHAVQTALLAERDGAPAPLVVAALLHDVGHLLGPDPGATTPSRDLRHEEVAARFLARWFDDDVVEPVRRHVAAKRYLCATDAGYAARLSPASVHSLALQGGPMSPVEAEGFLAAAGSPEAVLLRRWDDLAKDPDLPTPGIEHFRSLVATVAAGSARS